jgi:hypothetical protein
MDSDQQRFVEDCELDASGPGATKRRDIHEAYLFFSLRGEHSSTRTNTPAFALTNTLYIGVLILGTD